MADDKPAEATSEAKPAEPAKPAAAATAKATAEATADAPKTGKPMMHVKVFAPFKVYFEGDAYSLSATNESGPFDILPHHHNFLCMLLPSDLIITTAKETETIKISRALMHVKAEMVTVYLDV